MITRLPVFCIQLYFVLVARSFYEDCKLRWKEEASLEHSREVPGRSIDEHDDIEVGGRATTVRAGDIVIDDEDDGDLGRGQRV